MNVSVLLLLLLSSLSLVLQLLFCFYCCSFCRRWQRRPRGCVLFVEQTGAARIACPEVHVCFCSCYCFDDSFIVFDLAVVVAAIVSVLVVNLGSSGGGTIQARWSDSGERGSDEAR